MLDGVTICDTNMVIPVLTISAITVYKPPMRWSGRQEGVDSKKTKPVKRKGFFFCLTIWYSQLHRVAGTLRSCRVFTKTLHGLSVSTQGNNLHAARKNYARQRVDELLPAQVRVECARTSEISFSRANATLASSWNHKAPGYFKCLLGGPDLVNVYT